MKISKLDQSYLDESVNLLSNLVKIESSDPPGNEKVIGNYLLKYLKKANIETDFDEFKKNRINLFSKIKGSGKKKGLIFSAHLDTMPVGKRKWIHNPFSAKIINNKLYGRGSSDMKSGISSMILAFKAIYDYKINLKGDLILILSAGESSSLIGAKQFIKSKKLKNMGAFLVSEPTSLKLITAEKGALWLKVIFFGKSGHSSGGTKNYNNAIETAIKFIEQFKKIKFNNYPHRILGNTTFSFNKIIGGAFVNITPDHCELDIDIRTLPNQKYKDIIKKIRKSIKLKNYEIKLIDFKQAVDTSKDTKLLNISKKVLNQYTNTALKIGGVSYTTDGSIICNALKIPMLILGPGEKGMSGQQDEYVNLNNVKIATELYFQIAINYLS